MIMLVALKRAGGVVRWQLVKLLGAGVLGDSLGALRDSMLGKLSRQQEPHRGLDLTGGDGRPFVVVSKTAGLSSNTLKKVIDKGVHDAHGLGGDTSVRVDLLQHFVDVDGIGLLPLLLLLLLISLGDGFGSLARLGSSLSRGLGGHVVSVCLQQQLTDFLSRASLLMGTGVAAGPESRDMRECFLAGDCPHK